MVPSISDFSVTHDLNSVRSVWNILAHSFASQTSDCFGLAESQQGLWALSVCDIHANALLYDQCVYISYSDALSVVSKETGCDVIEEGRALETQ